MDLDDFRAALRADDPPDGLELALRVLWLDARGDWDGAHGVAQDMAGADGAWLHAYLHRKEGDLGNAGYWYRRAGRELPDVSLAGEWEEIARWFLTERGR